MYIRFPLSLRQVEDLLSERGIDICHETARFWWNRFGPMIAAEIRNADAGSTTGPKIHTNRSGNEKARCRNFGT